MKLMKGKNYGSIPHLSNSKLGEMDHYIHEGQERILTKQTRDRHDTVLVFEKYDGSNVGVLKKSGKIYALTRSGHDATTSPFDQHLVFAEWVKSFEHIFQSILGEGERVVGEWMYQAHGIIYDIFAEPIIFFDFFDSDNKRKPFAVLQDTLLPVPRVLHKGAAVEVEYLLPILNQKTCFMKAQTLPEGMVYRVERKGKVDFLAKWVRPDFEAGKYIIRVDTQTLNNQHGQSKKENRTGQE